MRNKPLGRTGLFVSELCLGTMTFGGSSGIWGQIGKLQQDDAERLVGQALDAGVNFIDTADIYAGGASEQITGQALKNLKVPRENVIVATKVFGDTSPGPNGRGASRSHIFDGVKASLKRLQLEHIDLYQIHGFDPATPIEETVRALDQLVRRLPASPGCSRTNLPLSRPPASGLHTSSPTPSLASIGMSSRSRSRPATV